MKWLSISFLACLVFSNSSYASDGSDSINFKALKLAVAEAAEDGSLQLKEIELSPLTRDLLARAWRHVRYLTERASSKGKFLNNDLKLFKDSLAPLIAQSDLPKKMREELNDLFDAVPYHGPVNYEILKRVELTLLKLPEYYGLEVLQYTGALPDLSDSKSKTHVFFEKLRRFRGGNNLLLVFSSAATAGLVKEHFVADLHASELSAKSRLRRTPTKLPVAREIGVR